MLALKHINAYSVVMKTYQDPLPEVRAYIAQHQGKLRQLAVETGVSYSLICKINHGQRENLTLDVVRRIMQHRDSQFSRESA